MPDSISARNVPSLLQNLASRKATVGVLGLGYVGIPLALTAIKAGYRVLGFDVDKPRTEQLNRGELIIKHIKAADIADAVQSKRFEATSDFSRLHEPDAILICVPTPLTKHREPDLSFVEQSSQAIAKAAARPVDRLGIDNLSGNDGRSGEADPGSWWPQKRQGLLPGVFARARRPLGILSSRTGIDFEDRWR